MKRNESGFLSAEWLAGVGILVLPTFILVMSIVQFPARKNLTQVASAAAARAYVQALDQSQADAAARAAAAEVIAGEYGDSVDASNEDAVSSYLYAKHIDVGEPKFKDGNDGTAAYCPGTQWTVSVSAPYPIAINPFGNSLGLPGGAKITSSASDRIDDYAEVTGDDTDNGKCDPDSPDSGTP